MADALGSRRQDSSVGTLLQGWRKARQLSQLALATQAEISSRHLCFIETGRAKPSREMVLLLAAGFAPVYRESTLDAPELAAVRSALDAILRQQEPFPAVVMNRHWDILSGNEAAARFFGFLLEDRGGARPANVLRMMFHPDGLRPYVTNWEAVAEALVHRVHREAVGGVQDEPTRQLLAEILSYPGVPRSWRPSHPGTPVLPVIPIGFQKHDRAFQFFSAVTTLGTPQDITVQEIRIECFFPADDQTRRAAHQLASRTAADAPGRSS